VSRWVCRRCRRRRLIIATSGNRAQVRGVERVIDSARDAHYSRRRVLRVNQRRTIQ